MKYPFLCSWVILFFWCLPILQAQKILDGVVRIETTNIFDQPGESGAGIMVNNVGNTLYIVTAYHVIRDAKTVNVQFHHEGGKLYPVELGDIESSPELDIAMLRLNKQGNYETFFRIVDPYVLKNGLAVTMIGHPRGGKNWVVNKRNQIEDIRFRPAKISATNFGIAGGFSGGPLLSKNKNRLIGIINERNSVQVISTDIEDIFVQLQDWGVDPNLLLEPRRAPHKLTFPLLGLSAGSLAVGLINKNDIADKYAIYREYRDPTAPVYEEIGIPRDELLADLKTKKHLLVTGSYVLAGVAAATTVWLNIKKRRLPAGRVSMEIAPFFPYGGEIIAGMEMGLKFPF